MVPLVPSPVAGPPNVALSALRHVVPWIMLATALRLLAFASGAPILPGIALSDVAIFLAFLVGAHAMIGVFGGETRLGALGIREQIKLSHRILLRVVLLLVIACALVSIVYGIGWGRLMLLGFDGIAYDQASNMGIVWSSLLAPIVFLMVVQAGGKRPVSLVEALREFVRRIAWLGPAVVAIAAFALAFSALQGYGRGLVRDYWMTSDDSEGFKGFVYFTFIFVFATVRLMVTLAILTLALRQSYRRGPATVPTVQ